MLDRAHTAPDAVAPLGLLVLRLRRLRQSVACRVQRGGEGFTSGGRFTQHPRVRHPRSGPTTPLQIEWRRGRSAGPTYRQSGCWRRLCCSWEHRDVPPRGPGPSWKRRAQRPCARSRKARWWNQERVRCKTHRHQLMKHPLSF
eukprot:359855-Chlamydomonas_euryale.AAC.4